MITFDNAGKRFGNLDAVKDFSITIKDGEILGLLGPNGAGKTTLMLKTHWNRVPGPAG